jgi:hypothetical protein
MREQEIAHQQRQKERNERDPAHQDYNYLNHMQSYVDNAMKITEKLGLAKKGDQNNMESAKETLTLSGTLSDPHRGANRNLGQQHQRE